MTYLVHLLTLTTILLAWNPFLAAQEPAQPTASDKMDLGRLRWKVAAPFLSIADAKLPEPDTNWLAVKDPSIVRYANQWHLFCTLRNDKKGDGRIRIGYAAFGDWADARDSSWSLLELTPGYHGAPQIFWFEPDQLWYLIYQAEDSKRGLKYGPCYSTNADLSKPEKWTRPKPLYVVGENQKAGLDFWVICDERRAHLFFTSLNGKMWRAETSLQQFPDEGWSKPAVALKANIFEASHTYRLKDRQQYLTIVEAQGDRRRHFKGFVADQLSGPWMPVKTGPWVSPSSVVNQPDSWATSYSHGEFLRTGYDQTLTIDLPNTQLLFQGANDKDYRQSYGQIPWKLGLLEPIRPPGNTKSK